MVLKDEIQAKKKLKFAMIAGEQSGDNIGSSLIKEIKKKYPHAFFYGIGGKKMIKEGFISLAPIELLSIVGLLEVLGSLVKLIKLRKFLIYRFIKDQPDVFIGIDAPDFNLEIEYQLKHANIKTIHYVSPQIWAWRKGRIKKIKQSVDHMLCLFPFEPAIYHQNNIHATFVGHLLADDIPIEIDQEKSRRLLKLEDYEHIISIMPGSRKSEIKYLGHIFLKTARELKKKLSNIKFIIPVANEKCRAQIILLLNDYPDLNIMITNDAYLALSSSYAVLIASGTATLEAILHKCPMVIGYRISMISYLLMKHLYGINQNIGLPNILANKLLFAEYIQTNMTVNHLTEEMLKVIGDQKWRKEVLKECVTLHRTLRKNASQVAWKTIEDEMNI